MSHFLLSFFGLLVGFAPLAALAEGVLPLGTRYVMAHFKGDGGGGDERLFISVSEDSLHWTALNGGAPVWQPEGWAPFQNVVRDPAILYTQGAYWVVYTSGNYGHRDSSQGVRGSFGLVRSTDLRHWTHVTEVSTVTPGATDPLTWSPTFFQDGDGTVHVYVAIRPDSGRDYNPIGTMRVHEVHPLNATWTEWSAPAPVELPSTNSNEFWVWKEGPAYHGIFVDFARQGAPYVHVTSTSPVSRWGAPQVLGFYGQEGGFVLKQPAGGYRLYLEHGNNNAPGTYLVAEGDAQLQNFTAQQAVEGTVPLRNGKAIAAPNGTAYTAWARKTLASRVARRQLPQADADGDRLRNEFEFATGGAPVERPAGSDLVTYWQSNGAEAAPVLEVSPNRRRWYRDAAHLAPLSRTLFTDGREQVVLQDLASPTTARRFYRLRTALYPSPLRDEADAAYEQREKQLSHWRFRPLPPARKLSVLARILEGALP